MAHPNTPVQTIRLEREKNLDKQIDICRFGARKDNVRVVIEKVTKDAQGNTLHRRPILEITPDGDLREITVPPMRVSIRERAIYSAQFPMNRRALDGAFRLGLLVADTEEELKFQRNEAKVNRRNPRPRKGKNRRRTIVGRVTVGASK